MDYKVNWNTIRILILLCGTILGALAFILGFLLIKQGAVGEFEILGEGKGVKFFVTSVSPGIFIVLVGGLLVGLAFRIQKQCLGLPDSKQLKARGGAIYYQITDRNGKDDELSCREDF